jgi:two-component system, LytTR family, sensor kinase
VLRIDWKESARSAYSFILRTKLYHLFFWVIYTLTCALIIQPGRTPLEWVKFSSAILLFHALVAYFNINVLVNHLLYKRHYLSYALCLILSIVAVSFPIAILFHRYIHNKDLQQFVWSTNFFLLNWASISLTTLLVLTLKLLFNWYKEEQNNKSLQKVNVETELKFLKAQINPHFLFNSLNNLYALTLMKSDKAPDVVLKLSNILRYVLYETGDGRVPLAKEVDYIEDYIELEKLRLGSEFDLSFTKIGNFKSVYVEPMIFLTFLENSFKHGVSQDIKKSWLSLKIEVIDDEIFFEIENPKNLNNNKLEANGGIGLENLRKRLDLIYHNRYTLTIDDKNTFKVILKIKNYGK